MGALLTHHLSPPTPQRFSEHLLYARCYSRCWEATEDKPGTLPSHSLHSRGTQTAPGFILWLTHRHATYDDQVGDVGKGSVTDTECWVCGLGVPGGAQGEKKTALSAAREGRRIQEMVGEEADPGCTRPCRRVRTGFLSVRSQGRLLCGE